MRRLQQHSSFLTTTLKQNIFSQFSTSTQQQQTYKWIKSEVSPSNNRVTQITLNNPKKRNTLSLATIEELHDAFQRVGAKFQKEDNYPKAVVLQAEGNMFSAGHDLKEIQSNDPTANRKLFGRCSELMKLLRALPVPVVASVNGLATAAGCQLAAAADLVVASEKSQFQCPGVKLGLFCTTPGVSLARSVTATKFAFEMLVTGDAISVQEAQRYGLVNHIVQDNGDIAVLRRETAKYLERFLCHSAETIAHGKQAFYKQIEYANLSDAYQYACGQMTDNVSIPDCQEGITSFVEKRHAHFKN